MDSAHRQSEFAVRCDWGLSGARAIAVDAEVVVVVDVLSFTTCVSVAVDRGASVYPYRWRDDSASAFAREHGAELAVGRTAARPGEVSLSPSSIRDARGLDRLVLPSPNGSTIVHDMAQGRATVLAASLRNASAVAAWIDKCEPRGVAVVAAGERWPEGPLRPAVEDLWGSGAVIDALDPPDEQLSPEARVARDSWRAVSDSLPGALWDCASGRELIALGFGGDVDVAAEIGSSAAVPLLQNGRFDHASPS